MAESIFDALSGGESEDAAATAPASGPHPFAAALAADMTRHDPEVAAETANFLRRQSALLRAQELALEDERKGFDAEWAPRRTGVWLKFGFQIFTALVVTVLGVGAALMLSDAVNSHSVIVEPFDAPPAMAASGLSGKVVASGLLDELTRLQAATRSAAAKRHLDDDWTGDIKVDIPDTGISIGEIGRLLHQRFGHDLHIGGDLVQTGAGGLTLTVRGDGVLPKAFTGGAGDLAKLTTEAAEYVYGESQPGLFIHYLTDVNRNDEAIAFAKSHLARAGLAPKAARMLWHERCRYIGNRCASSRATGPAITTSCSRSTASVTRRASSRSAGKWSKLPAAVRARHRKSCSAITIRRFITFRLSAPNTSQMSRRQAAPIRLRPGRRCWLSHSWMRNCTTSTPHA
jgi:hypothetical protein